ncbi:MAG: hypothetical protein N2111_12290 [Candidatus Sumerlaeaceae bacterium]|nr:hypothetical protein [Candidatus Sumerlaeaceae bacterium]
MTTTIIFVELLLAGVGALSWAVPVALLLTGAGPQALTGLLEIALSERRYLAAGLGLLALAYPLGVVVDAVSDYLLDAWDGCVRRKVLKETTYDRQPSGFLALCVFGLRAEAATVFNYVRMRLRVARTAALNALLASVTLPFVLRRIDSMQGGWWALEAVIVCLLMAGGSLLAWHQSTPSFYKFTKQCREAMAARQKTAPSQDAGGETWQTTTSS